MTAIGIIPARYASTRFPGKVLADINGFPMVHHVYTAGMRSSRLDAVLIATDDTRIAAAVAQLGDRVILTAQNHRSGTDRIAEAFRSSGQGADIIVNIQGDEPQLDPALIDQLVDLMEAHLDLPMGTAVSTGISGADKVNPGVVKVVVEGDRATGFYRESPSDLPTGALYRHVGIYAYRKEFLTTFTAQAPTDNEMKANLEQLRALDMGVPIGVVVSDYAGVAVDTPEDLQTVLSSWTAKQGAVA